jgi:hypothetical protein
VTQLGLEKTHIALCQFLRAGIAKAPTEAFFGPTIAVNTIDFTVVLQRDGFPHQGIHFDLMLTKYHRVVGFTL